MTTEAEMDPREVARQIGIAMGDEGMTDQILSGMMTADDALPLVAGMVDGAVRNLAVPILQSESWTGFDPSDRPMQAMLRLKDGTAIMITLESL